MIDRAGKKAARRSMGKAIPECDIDRLLTAARTPGATPARATAASQDDFASRLDINRNPPGTVLTDTVNAHAMTMWDIPVLILYACLGVFTRIWTDVTLYFEFGEDDGFQVFAIGVSMALHGFIFAVVANAWRAKWEIRIRNLLALAALGGYLGFRTLTQL